MERVEWFSDVHYDVLSFFHEHDIPIAPRELADAIEYDRQYIARVLQQLTQAGFLRRPKRGQYRLATGGRRFLAGELTVEELQDMTPDDASDE